MDWGILLTWLIDRYEVFGSDINEWALQQACKNVPRGALRAALAENLETYRNESFQIVIAKHVVEHLPHPDKAIAEMSRVLAPGWLFIPATPNLDSPMRARKKDQWVGYKDPTHISLKPPAEWLGLLRRHGLRPKCVFSDGFWDAPYVHWLPARLQKLLFGAPGGLQAILGWSIIPLRMGESLIVLADKR